MIHNLLNVSIEEAIKCLSAALRFVSPDIAKHHSQVAYISYKISDLLGFSETDIKNITLAAALHDIGAVSLEKKLDALRFEDNSVHDHAQLGFLFLDKFNAFKPLAPLVKYHHRSWNKNNNESNADECIPIGSHIIHLADRAAVLIKKAPTILMQKKDICSYLTTYKGSLFNAEHVEAFCELADKEYFWLDCSSQSLDDILQKVFKGMSVQLGHEHLIDYCRFLSRLVDFRSPLNANHSSGVAASAAQLARLAGFSDYECDMMLMAGYLHDIGKLAVPAAILEKPGALDERELSIIKTHSYFSYAILQNIKDFKVINKWASFHHERQDGRGYPFKISSQELPQGSQIMAVADIYTALNEDRPYRLAMSREESMRVMTSMIKNGAINGDLVELLDSNFDGINYQRCLAQQVSAEEYNIINPLFARGKIPPLD